MSARRERPGSCGWCKKPTRERQHEDGMPCLVTCPRCGVEVVYNDAGDSLEHPTVESWSACDATPHGPYVSIFTRERVTT